MLNKYKNLTFIIISFLLISISSNSLAQNYKAFNKGKYYIYVNEYGHKAFKGKYEEAIDFSEGRGAVKKDDLWGFINSRGDLVIEAIYDEVWPFVDGKARVKVNGKIRSIDRYGRSAGYYTINNYALAHEGLSRYREKDKYGFVSSNVKVIIPMIYDTVADFNKGYARVCKAGKWGVINKKEETIIAFEYDEIFPLWYDYYMVKKNKDDQSRYNYINLKTEYLSEQWFDEGISFFQEKAFVRLKGKNYSLSLDGSLLELPDSIHIISACVVKSDEDKEPKKDADTLEKHVNTFPAFMGGDKGRNLFLRNTIQYPDIERDNGIQGQVVVSFLLDKHGQIKNPEIIKGVTPGINLEVLRVINAMPPWEPGTIDGIPVCVTINLPIRFTLN